MNETPDVKPHHIGISIPDLEAAIQWYSANLGFVVERQMEIAAVPARVAWLRRDNFRIELFEVAGAAALPDDRRVPNRDLKTHGTKHLAFAVQDVDAVVAELKQRGVDIAMHTRIQGEPMAFIRDNAGTLIELVQASSFSETMKYSITQDSLGTHIDWKHEAVTAKMIDWFWSNMEKAFLLWHPEEHDPLTWVIPPRHGNPVGAIHLAPQTWSDGTRQNLYIRFEDLAAVPEDVKQYIIYEHVIIVAGLGFGPESLVDPKPLGYRLHQWQKADEGVIGKSTAIGTRKPETPEEGMVWAKHCVGEVGNWGLFLPQLYKLYQAVKNTNYNPYTDLSVEGTGVAAKYKYSR